jgi:hypothetical protein
VSNNAGSVYWVTDPKRSVPAFYARIAVLSMIRVEPALTLRWSASATKPLVIGTAGTARRRGGSDAFLTPIISSGLRNRA